MSKAIKLAKEQQELEQKESENKVKVFLTDYKALCDKHGLEHIALLSSNQQALFAELRIQEKKKESPILKP